MRPRLPPGEAAALRTALDTHLSPVGARAVQLRDIVITGGRDKDVPHKLAAPLQGWVVTRLKNNSSLAVSYPWEVKSDRKTLTLASPVDITVDLLVW